MPKGSGSGRGEGPATSCNSQALGAIQEGLLSAGTRLWWRLYYWRSAMLSTVRRSLPIGEQLINLPHSPKLTHCRLSSSSLDPATSPLLAIVGGVLPGVGRRIKLYPQAWGWTCRALFFRRGFQRL